MNPSIERFAYLMNNATNQSRVGTLGASSKIFTKRLIRLYGSSWDYYPLFWLGKEHSQPFVDVLNTLCCMQFSPIVFYHNLCTRLRKSTELFAARCMPWCYATWLMRWFSAKKWGWSQRSNCLSNISKPTLVSFRAHLMIDLVPSQSVVGNTTNVVL